MSSEEAALQKFGYKQELSRSLSMTDLVIYGMIFMVPIAPFAVYGVVYKDAKGMVPLAYLLGLVGMFFTALSYAEGCWVELSSKCTSTHATTGAGRSL